MAEYVRKGRSLSQNDSVELVVVVVTTSDKKESVNYRNRYIVANGESYA
jgi:hypothetical protein